MNRPITAWIVGILIALAIMFGPSLLLGTEMPAQAPHSPERTTAP